MIGHKTKARANCRAKNKNLRELSDGIVEGKGAHLAKKLLPAKHDSVFRKKTDPLATGRSFRIREQDQQASKLRDVDSIKKAAQNVPPVNIGFNIHRKTIDTADRLMRKSFDTKKRGTLSAHTLFALFRFQSISCPKQHRAAHPCRTQS